ncbi:MAG: hypothetical protein WD572_01205 [Gammaproteobacteria bacterium]
MSWFSKKKDAQKKSDRDIKEEYRKLKSAAEKAEKLIARYGKVLEHPSHDALLQPLSSLPKSKEEIRKAFITHLFFLHISRELDENTINALQACYILLANFVDDESANLSYQAWKAFESYDISSIASNETKAAIDKFTQSKDEMDRLNNEFRTIVSKMRANTNET